MKKIPESEKPVRTSITLPPKVLQKILAEAEKNRSSANWVINGIVLKWFKNH